MRFGLFYELQLPRPWQQDSERRIVRDTLDQIELADRLGFDYAWAVEHHFLEEYSHCSAPEVLLGAASQRTERIRLGHGVMVLPQQINAAPRVAERIGMLDLVSNGRVEFGSGESGTAVELGGFGVDRDTKRQQWRESLEAVTRMFVEEPFAGYEGQHVQLPQRNIVPKPVQRPHPPLWTACTRRESLSAAAAAGLGALTFSFLEPQDAHKWVGEYYDTIMSPECVPLGFSVNPQVAMTMYLMCHEDEQVARDRGLNGHRFFARSLAYYYGTGSLAPGRTDLSEELGLDLSAPQDGGWSQSLDGAYGGVGAPDKVRRVLREYEDAGVDQILLIAQSGRIGHDHICESMELFAREVMPEFHDRHEAAEQKKQARLRPAIEAALARRAPAHEADRSYRVPPTTVLPKYGDG
jgi:alkanesulfonate monooxygenase SsuD/methylene tetrahydromethanopterin reductase-like flavin-dependent oxidoreductase (luciferase family)